ncbi:MAG: hypothetical protein ACOYJA_12825 [Christensenellales bacterium]|jgi:hypothetical protein
MAGELTFAQARAAAERWVQLQGARYPGFAGAYIAGSYAGAPAQALYDPTSDVDVVLVLDAVQGVPKPGKFVWEGVLLEVSLLPAADFRDERTVLTTHYIGYALSRPTLLADPTGLLSRAAGWVVQRYGQPQWVRRRCQAMLARIRRQIASFDPAQDYPSCASGYLFTVGITTFPILLAAQANCTVRKRYCAARQVLARCGLEEAYPRLMRLIDPRQLPPARLQKHLDRLETVFDAACASRGPSKDYAFRQDISPEARPIAIDGSRALIRSAHPGEAVFWMGATFARCQTIFSLDDPDLKRRYQPNFSAFMADLEAGTPECMAARLTALTDELPWIERLAEQVLARHQP